MKLQILKEAPPKYYPTMHLAQIILQGSDQVCLAQKWKSHKASQPEAWVVIPSYMVGKENVEAEPEVV